MTLEEFVRALDSAGLDLHVEGLLDTLWLAQVDRTLSARRSIARHAMRDTAPGGQPSFKPDGDVTPPVSDQQSVEPPTEPPAQPPVTDPPDSAPVYSAGPAGAADKTFRASPVVVPAGHALSKRLALGRALRPFRRRWASRTDREIDEDRTVDISADLGGMYPVFRPRAERWYDAVVVMEDDPAIEIWQDVLRDFCQMLRHTGAFRDVRRLRLRMDPKPFLESVPGGARSRASSLSGGGARRLVFFATHGSSSKWADGRYARLIEPWMGTCSVAILQMQPPRRWKWTVLGEPQGVCTALQPGVSSARLQLEPNWWSFLSADDERVIGLPVVPLESAAMSEFAYMQMARGRRCPLLLLDTSELDADEMQFLPVPSPDAERTLALLRESAPLSYQLAVYLAGGPFTLPVARIVQEAMFGDAADQSHLADVLLSGQVTSPQTTALAVDPNLVYYEFKPEARAILLRSLREADAERIAEGLETCVSQYIEKVYGRTITFQGLVPDENGEYELPAWAQSFARLSVALLGLPGRKVKAEASQAYTDLLIRIVASSDGNQIVEAIINSGAPSARAHLKLDMSLLERLKPEDATYGQELDRAILFGPVLSALDEAMKRPASSNGKGRIRLEIDQGLGLLHGIAWERMTLPDGMPSIMPFSRYIPTGASVPQPLTARRIRMSICIDRPTSTEVALELTSLMATLSAAAIAGNLDVTLLTGHTSLSDALRSDVERAGWRIVDGPTTLNAIIARLAVDDIVHIDAPGSGSGVQGLSLDLKTGSGAWSLDSEIVRTAGPRLPALVTVCLPWRTGEKRAFHELPAALVRAGASAVLALQDQIAPNSGRQIGQAFYRALFETGLVDYAVTTARQELREAGAADWWMPVLYSRVPDCRLLSVDRAASPQDSVKAFVSAYPKRDVGRVARLAASTGGEKFAANTIGTELSRSLERDGLVRQYGDGTFRFLPGIEPLLSEIVSKQPLLGVHILWVDDHPDRIASFANDLRGRGAEIDEVILEDVAMKFLEHAAYDVVISDMKRGNDRQAGISLLRAMQSRRIASPVVIFSGRFAANRVQEILGEGAFGYTKVYSELRDLVRDAVSSRHGSTYPGDIRARRILAVLRELRAPAGLMEAAPTALADFALQATQSPDEGYKNCLKLIRAYAASTVTQLILRIGRELRVVADIVDDESSRYAVASWKGVIGQAATSGKLLWVPDVRKNVDYIAAEPSTRSELAVPFREGGSVVGVVNIEMPRADALNRDDLIWLDAFCRQLISAIPATRFQEVRENKEFPLWLVIFDKDGNVTGPALDERFYSELERRGINDVLVFVHGWNRDRTSARALLERVSARVQEVSSSRSQRLGILGVLWPSQWAEDEESVESKEDLLEHSTDAGEAAGEDSREGQGTESERHTAAVPPIGVSGALGGLWQATKSVLRTSSYFVMRTRAANIGTRGLAPLVKGLSSTAPHLRVHLVAHSMGARLACHALLEASQIQSLTLLQATVSDHVFAAHLTTEPPQEGAFWKALPRVDGPVIVTYSSRDSNTANAHAVAMRLVATDDDVPGYRGDYKPLGSAGAKGIQALEVPLQPVGIPYSFERGHIYNVDASATILDHNDITGPEIAWLLISIAAVR